MKSMPATKYRPFSPIALPDRIWPDRTLQVPPRWCSVDLRDGNQALVEPMGPERKHRLFQTLLEIGFDEIEVGFPASSQTDFDFVRELIEGSLIPDGLTIQVLTQARTDLIDRTFEAIRGTKRAIVHVYNSTSELQRRVVFKLDRAGVTDLAVRAIRHAKQRALELDGTDVQLEYSPESFTGTELDYAVEICEAVMDVWCPSPREPIILNLPATVEMSMPNVYADMIEWFGRTIRDRDCVVLSVHPHNDRGTAVAAAELALLAGADRIEGTLFGNGERTGNVDVVTLALNLFTQGVDPGLAIWDIDAVARVSEYCTRLPVHPRHPYAGELVYTAFAGSHQDAIKKGLASLSEAKDDTWQVPYLPIDPADVGRSYEAVIRINSQSGKGGIAYVLENDHGVRLPRGLQTEFRDIVQQTAEQSVGEVTSTRVWELFCAQYLERTAPFELLDYRIEGSGNAVSFQLHVAGETVELKGTGGGPIEALAHAFAEQLETPLSVVVFEEHALGSGSGAEAVAYIQLVRADGTRCFGVGRAKDVLRASLEAFISAANRLSFDRPSSR